MLTINKAIVAALMIASSSCSFLDSTQVPRSVVVIVIDTLRADHMGIYGYPRPTSPNIDRFATEGIVFENFYSSSTWTLPSFGSLFTGELPSRHWSGIIRTIDQENGKHSFVEHADRRFSQLDEKLPTLATSLGLNGFATFAVVNNAFVSFPDRLTPKSRLLRFKERLCGSQSSVRPRLLASCKRPRPAWPSTTSCGRTASAEPPSSSGAANTVGRVSPT